MLPASGVLLLLQGGDGLRQLYLEHRVVGEVHAFFELDRPGAVVGRHLGHSVGERWFVFGRPGKVVVGVEALKDVRRDDAGIEIVNARRIKPGFGCREGISQHLGLSRLCARSGQGKKRGARRESYPPADVCCHAQGPDGRTGPHCAPPCASRSLSISTYFQKLRTKILR